MSLGEKIQILRKQKGMTQDQLAEILNVSRQAISKWETNESQPDIERLAEIGNLFNVSTDFLIKGEHSYAPAHSYTHIPKTREINSGFLRHSRIAFLVSVIYSAATGVFLLLGFVWGLWHPGWLVFFVPPFIVRFLQHTMSKDMADFQAFEDAIEEEDD